LKKGDTSNRRGDYDPNTLYACMEILYGNPLLCMINIH
jgi:hypothetical protein